MIFTRIKKAFSKPRRHSAAVQFALFAMLVQAMIPLSAAIALPGADAQSRGGQDLPGFYLVICTAHGTQTLAPAQALALAQTQAQNRGLASADHPLNGGKSALKPWECPCCQAQVHVQGPAPETPQVALTPYPLPLGWRAPVESDRVSGLWNTAPNRARGPPSA